MILFFAVLMLVLLLAVELFTKATESLPNPKMAFEIKPPAFTVAPGTTATLEPIIYRGGPLLSSPSVYLIWYGTWNGEHKQLIRDFLHDLNGSSNYGVTGQSIAPQINFIAMKNEVNDNYSRGRALSDRDVMTIVQKSLNKLSTDTRGAYFVLTAPDVRATSGFGTKYCGWHTYYSSGAGKNVRFAFVGDPKNFMSTCASQRPGSNGTGNESIDAMISVIGHELVEMITDPNINAWYDSRVMENADKCGWTYGDIPTANNGSKYNLTLPRLLEEQETILSNATSIL